MHSIFIMKSHKYPYYFFKKSFSSFLFYELFFFSFLPRVSSFLSFADDPFFLLKISSDSFNLYSSMALRLNPIPTQTFSLPQMPSLRSPRFRMASTLRSGSKLVPLSDPPLHKPLSPFLPLFYFSIN